MINILITAIGGGGHGEQVLKALRLANNPLYRLHGADMNPNSPQKKLVEEFCVLPNATNPKYFAALTHFIKRKNIDVLIHGCEPELKIFSEKRSLLEELGVKVLINSPEVIQLCMNKFKTANKLRELGFQTINQILVRHLSELQQILWFPVVVKPNVGGGGSSNVFICQDFDELINICKYLRIEEDLNGILIQEYVGTSESEFTVGVLSDFNGDLITSIGLRRQLSGQMNVKLSVRNRTSRIDLGSNLIISSGISQGEIKQFPEVTHQCEEIAKAIGSRGPLNIQCRLVDGQIKVFEINPRFSGTTSIRALAGVNEPDILIQRNILGNTTYIPKQIRELKVIRSLIETEVD